MARKIIIGNWKMNPATLSEAEKLFGAVAKLVSRTKKTDIVICPPDIYLEKLSKIRSSKIKFGAQDSASEKAGAFTGEVSAEMLYNLGARYVILGHSERRAMGEEGEEINKKIKMALNAGLRPVLCVGEVERQEDHAYFNLIETQIKECLDGVKRSMISNVIVAYEPVWAISSTSLRRDATPADSLEMAIFIRKVLADKFGKDAAKVKVIYGGSVNEKNAEGFLREGGVDGLLPGRASLTAQKFFAIISASEQI